MVLARGGQALNGAWYEGGAMQGSWSGRRDPALKSNRGPLASSLAADIAATGRAIAYGIRFASDSDKLTPESEPVLKEVADLMNKTKALKLGVQGHTDATNTDAYNMDLSLRRARAVVAWLTKNGIAADRLAAEGFGKARPVADNATPQGRALNRRVELAAMP
jgi:outer membrane protein OmpA-like peptidoglycan-associated protein